MKEILNKEALKGANDYLENALEYIGKDKTITDEEMKVEIRKTLTSTLNCTYDSAKQQFEVVRASSGERESSGRKGVGDNQKEILGYHVWQSFKEKINRELSHEIGKKLAQEIYGDYQCVISTHDNTEHTHNHIVFNATSFKTGKKFNICTANTRKLREVSDRLCEEYGLSVLRDTREMKLTWYKDGAGKRKCFEKTERNREKRKGEFTKITDYRNYEAYQNGEIFKESNCKIIRRDIDRFIPVSHSLDELIENLQGIGYEVKNLNSKGGYLQYIAFKALAQEKFTRGNTKTLGEDYTRESLIRRIAEFQKNKEATKTVSPENSGQAKGTYKKPVYKYGKIDIENIDEEQVMKYSKKLHKWVMVPRYEVEKYIIADTKILNQNIENIYKKSSRAVTFEKQIHSGKNAKTQYHIDRINENLRALEFIEDKNLRSFEQINSTVQSLYEKRDEVNVEFLKIKELLKAMNQDIVLIKQYNNLKTSIENNKGDSDYAAFELQGEMALLKQYEEVLKVKKLFTPTEQADRVSKFDSFTKRFEELGKAYRLINDSIADYDRTVYVINRIDRDSDRRYSAEIKSYYDMRSANRSNKGTRDKAD